MNKYIGILLCVLLVGCSGEVSKGVTAKILSVNTHILVGNMKGAWLSSASGNIANDVNKLGVAFELGEHSFLEDITLNHAQTASLVDCSEVKLRFELNWIIGDYWATLYYCGYPVGSMKLEDSYGESLRELIEGQLSLTGGEK